MLASREQVAGAFLFGSALEMCRPDSDIDIGLVLSPLTGLPEREYERVAGAVSNELPKIDGHAFHVIPLNTANSIFAFNVIRHGRLIYDRMPSVATDFIEETSRLYGENYPRYREALRLITGV